MLVSLSLSCDEPEKPVGMVIADDLSIRRER